ncbi:MAG: hypothetical protein ACKVN8_07135 [Nitrosarchaeum sp.]
MQIQKRYKGKHSTPKYQKKKEIHLFESIPTIDSRKKSLIEAAVNSFGGYPIAYGLGLVILPLSMGWIQKDPLTANLLITFIYSCVSLVRSYFLRRVFAKYGIDDNFIRLGIRGFKKIRQLFSNHHNFLQFRKKM